ncbi:ATP-dependent RNA helicase ddx54 [Trifolium repens]|nr:ATP-dependent RNA helicase ddx54 [Trifolium repens]
MLQNLVVKAQQSNNEKLLENPYLLIRNDIGPNSSLQKWLAIFQITWLPLILSGVDVVAMARTGSGKTAAFLVPMLHRINWKTQPGYLSINVIAMEPVRASFL